MDYSGRRVLLLFAILLMGCKSWNANDESGVLKLPKPRLARDSVAVDLTFVRVPTDEETLDQAIWAEADEQCIPPELRTHLNANGIRCGVIGRQLPSALIRLLEDSSAHRLDRDEIRETDVLTRARHQNWKSGQRVPIVATTSHDSLILLRKAKDSSSLSGKTFKNAQGFLAAKAFPQNNGTVRIELTPEIHFGDVTQQWIGGEGTWHLKSGKRRHVLSDLLLDLELSVGQALILSGTPQPHGVGKTLFVDASGGEPQQKMLFLRMSNSQNNALFDTLLNEPPSDDIVKK